MLYPIFDSFNPSRPIQAPVLHPIGPLAIGAIAGGISAAGSLLGGLFGKSSTKSANKANLQATRETNATNIRMMHEQNAFNLDMWNKQNEYNDPSAQRARYENAGINPYLALSNINSGNADSLMSASPNQMSTAHFEPVDYSFVGQSAQSAASTMLTVAQAQSAAQQASAGAIANAYQPAILATRLKQMNAEFGETNSKSRLNNIMAKVQETAFNDTVREMHAHAIGAELQNTMLSLQTYTQDLTNKDLFFKVMHLNPLQEKQMNEQINNTIANTWYQYTKGNNETRLTDKTIWKMSYDVACELYDSYSKRIEANASAMNAETNRAHLAIDQQNADSNTTQAVAAQTNASSNAITADSAAAYRYECIKQMQATIAAKLDFLNMQTKTGYVRGVTNAVHDIGSTISNFIPFAGSAPASSGSSGSSGFMYNPLNNNGAGGYTFY